MLSVGGHSSSYFNKITGYGTGCGHRSRYCAVNGHFDGFMQTITDFLSAYGLNSG
ncbi:hypothetical protein [Paenibacillus sp. Leaf72]|uniref:hypothetical protein n=1 Tax=Paenibacillus sp. Leaf72 TaxID=1736234 RepID=UPI000A86CCAF|nr:hypothetical protein [Paenibacillus sp. Leaf72]